MASQLPWSELPHDLLAKINNRLLQSPSDVCHFRSVCSSWRSSVPPFKMSLKVPAVLLDDLKMCRNLSQIIIYRIEPLMIDPLSSASPRVWVVAAEFVGHKLYFVDPLTSSRIDFNKHPLLLPKNINLCDFQITELQKVYSTELAESPRNSLLDISVMMRYCPYNTKKAVLIVSTQHYDGTLLATLTGRKLSFYKLVKNQWIYVEKEHDDISFKDIVLYEGRLWSVDNNGQTMIFTSSLEAIVISPSISLDRNLLGSYFVESLGDLFLVNQLNCPDDDDEESLFKCVDKRLTETKVYKMHKEENEWEEVKHLSDRVFFIADDAPWSFWLPSRNENCIYIESPELLCYFVRE